MDTPTRELPSRGLSTINVDEASTPRDIERRLGELYNDAIRAEVVRRERAAFYREAARAKRAARLQAVTREDCPRVSSSPRVTVSQREDWIAEQIKAEVDALAFAEDLADDANAYVKFLESQTSKMQTLARLSMIGYTLPQSGYGG